MKNWTIGTRVIAGFATVIVMTMILGSFAYIQVGRMHDISFEISENSLPSVYVIGQIHSKTERIFGLILQHIVSSDPQEMARLETDIKDLRSSNAALLKRYETLFSNDRDREL